MEASSSQGQRQGAAGKTKALPKRYSLRTAMAPPASQEALVKPVSAEGSRGEQGWVPVSPPCVTGLGGWGCKCGQECRTQKHSLFFVNLVLKCRNLLPQPVSPELCNVAEAAVHRDVALQEGNCVFAVHSQLLSLSPVVERGSQCSHLG